MRKYNPSGNLGDQFNVDGYCRGQALVAILKASGDNLTRENVMKQATRIHDMKLQMLLPGIGVSTGPDDFQPVKQMQLAEVRRHDMETVWRGHFRNRRIA